MKVKYFWIGIAVIVVVSAVIAYLQAVPIAVLEPAGPVALAERHVIFTTVLLCAIVVVPVFFLLFFLAWRYRVGGPHTEERHHASWDHDNWLAEAVWWFVPTLIIIVLGSIAWQSAHDLDPFSPLPSDVPPITIQVVALDWKWLFIYPAQGIASVNKVEFPAGTPVRFEITSDAPMNSFWIPALGGQMMAMPGMSADLNLMASRQGTFDGLSSEISGDGFAGMAFTADAVSSGDFSAWVASVQASSPPLTPAAYAALAKPSEYAPAVTYSAADGSIYTGSIMKYMMPDSLAAPADTP